MNNDHPKKSIHSSSLPPKQLSVLKQFLQHQLTQDHVVSYGDYEYPPIEILDENGKLSNVAIKLTNWMIQREKINHELIFNEQANITWRSYATDSFSIVSKIAKGKGGYSIVIELAGTYHMQADGNLQLSRKPRVIKVMEFKDKATGTFSYEIYKMATSEAEISSDIDYLHAKKITIENVKGKNIRSYLVLRNLGGVSLNVVLNRYLSRLNTTKRIRLAKNITRCLKEQIHDKGIAHLDINPYNILIDLSTLEAKIIDFGLSTKQNKESKSCHGSLGFLPPEAYTQKFPLNQKSDIFSLSVVWWLLFSDQSIEKQIQEQKRAIKSNKISQIPDLNLLFNYLYDLKAQHKIALRNSMLSMMDNDPTKRLEPGQAIDLLDRIELDRKLAWVFFSSKRTAIINAHQIAIDTYSILGKLTLEDNRIEKIQDVLFKALNNISHSSCAINEFVDVLGIKVFRKLKTKNAVKQKTSKIINDFFNHTKEIVALRCDAESCFQAYEENLFIIKNIPLYNQLKNCFKDLFAQIDNKLYKIDSIMYDKGRAITLDIINDANTSFYWKKSTLHKKMALLQTQIIPLLSCENILKRLGFESDDNDITHIKNRIRLAIKNYIDSTLTLNNLKNKDRAASTRRCQHMKEILAIVDTTPDTKQLLHSMKHKTYQINGFFGRSLLCKNINQAISCSPQNKERKQNVMER